MIRPSSPPSPRGQASRPSRLPTWRAPSAICRRREGGPMRILICGSLYLAGQVLALQEGVQAQAN